MGQLPANQITPTIVCNKHRTDNILRYIHRMICTICYFLCIEANGSCVTFMLECLQTIVNTYLSEMKMMFLNDTTHAHILIIFWIMQKDKIIISTKVCNLSWH